jgi:hypothetical protein
VPELDIVLINRPDVAPLGAGELAALQAKGLKSLRKARNSKSEIRNKSK